LVELTEDSSIFLGSASHPNLGEEVVAGRIAVDRWNLQFQSPALTFEIPLAKLHIELDDTAGGRVCFSDPDCSDRIIFTYDVKILNHRSLFQETHTRAQLQNFRNYEELKRRIKITVLFLAGFALLATLVSMGLGAMVRSLAAAVPPDFERKLGQSAMADLRRGQTFIDDPKLMTRLTNAVAPLLAILQDTNRQYRFYIIQQSAPNAFALPGGQVVVTAGLMDLVLAPEELAAVVAHEIAHLTQHHLFRQIIASAGPYLIFKLFVAGKAGVVSLLGASSQLLVQQSYSQAHETEADMVGFDYLVAAHIDPRFAIVVLRRLQAVERQDVLNLEPAAFSSHPPTGRRIRRLEAKWRAFPGKSAFEHTQNSQ
jgi:predicted Zn-dependent protease